MFRIVLCVRACVCVSVMLLVFYSAHTQPPSPSFFLPFSRRHSVYSPLVLVKLKSIDQTVIDLWCMENKINGRHHDLYATLLLLLLFLLLLVLLLVAAIFSELSHSATSSLHTTSHCCSLGIAFRFVLFLCACMCARRPFNLEPHSI